MIKKIQSNQYLTMPWKNGGGTTQEIYKFPENSSNWDFRISMAEVNQSGPFSLFPNFQRHLILLSGNGMVLNSDRFTHNMSTPLSPFTFSGDIKINAELINGPNIDFNVIWNPKKFSCDIQIKNQINIDKYGNNQLIFIFDTITLNSLLISKIHKIELSDGPYILIIFSSL